MHDTELPKAITDDKEAVSKKLKGFSAQDISGLAYLRVKKLYTVDFCIKSSSCHPEPESYLNRMGKWADRDLDYLDYRILYERRQDGESTSSLSSTASP